MHAVILTLVLRFGTEITLILHLTTVRCQYLKDRIIIRCMQVPIRLNLGKRIKDLRKECGYTQEKLAEAAGIDYKYLQRIEGKNPPAIKIDTIEKLAKALKVKPAELLEF